VVVKTSDPIASSTVLGALDYVLVRLGGHQLVNRYAAPTAQREPCPAERLAAER
jgi:hypothetical protein